MFLTSHLCGRTSSRPTGTSQRCSSSHWTIVVATYLISFLPACYHLRSQPASERALTLFRIKVRVCSLEHSSRFFFGYCTSVAKKSRHILRCMRIGGSFISIRICENLPPVHTLFSHCKYIRSYLPAASSFPLRLTWTCPALASYLGTGNFGFMVGCSQNRPPT